MPDLIIWAIIALMFLGPFLNGKSGRAVRYRKARRTKDGPKMNY